MDLDRLRAETPGTAHVVHLNNAGAALPPRPVTDRMIGHLKREAEIGGYEAAAEAGEEMAGVYRGIARMIGAGADEIALVDSATRAWDSAFAAFPFKPGDRVLVSEIEYVSNMIALLQMARSKGIVIDIVPGDAAGTIDLRELERCVDKDVALIALTHVPTGGGLVQPAAQVGAIARRAGIPFLLDACQSVGQMPIDVETIGCDMLAATGRKYLRGPRGTGFLYVSRHIVDRLTPPFLDLYSATWTGPETFEMASGARRFETFERNVAALLGLGVAVEYAQAVGLAAIKTRIYALAERLRTGLGEIAGVTVRDRGREKCGIVTFDMAGREAASLKTDLAAAGINVSVSPLSSNLIDFSARGIADVVRASVHYYNTEDEVDRFLEAVVAATG